MCLSLPGQAVTVRGPAALIETAGTGRWCNTFLHPELAPGDWVLVHAGLVMQVLSHEQAREIQQALAELANLDRAITSDERWPEGKRQASAVIALAR